MKTIKDLTTEQARELAELLYPFEVMGEFEMVYQPYDPSWYEDAKELIIIKFESYTFGDKIEPIRIHIDNQLNCYTYYVRDMLHFTGCPNQYKVQNLFKEWEILPLQQ